MVRTFNYVGILSIVISMTTFLGSCQANAEIPEENVEEDGSTDVSTLSRIMSRSRGGIT